jgi:site-specific recombinase XerD
VDLWLKLTSWASDATLRAYRCAINRFNHYARPLAPGCMALFDADLAGDGYAWTTRRLYTAALRRFLLYLETLGRAPAGVQVVHEIERLKNARGREHRIVQIVRVPAGFERLREYWYTVPLPDDRHPFDRLTVLRNRALIDALFSTAARRAELMSLTVADVWRENPGGHAVAQSASILGKGGYIRSICFSPRAQASIAAYLVERAHLVETAVMTDIEALWIRSSVRPAPLTSSGLYDIVRRTGAGVGVPGARPHLFRHYTARGLKHWGAQLDDVQAVLGHQSINTTRRIYAPADEEDLERLMRPYYAATDGPATGGPSGGPAGGPSDLQTAPSAAPDGAPGGEPGMVFAAPNWPRRS